MRDRDGQSNLGRVRKLCERWAWLAREEFRQLMADDCAYRDVPLPRGETIGPDAAFEKLSGLKNDWDIALQVVHIVGNDDTVMAERIERFHNRAGEVEDCELRCTGVFEFEAGRIKAWRDYWNLSDADPLLRYMAAKRP